MPGSSRRVYEDFTSYDGLALSGSLQGCWYTKVESSKETPSGVYLESGEEVFVGSVDGGAVGTFATTYKFESKWDPDVSSGVELRGRCQHQLLPVVAQADSRVPRAVSTTRTSLETRSRTSTGATSGFAEAGDARCLQQPLITKWCTKGCISSVTGSGLGSRSRRSRRKSPRGASSGNLVPVLACS